MKKLLTLLLIGTLVMTLLAACGADTTTTTTQPDDDGTDATTTQAPTTPADDEILPMRYYMPGGPTNQAEAVNEAINEKLMADGVNIEFLPQYYPWDEWVNKINISLSTGEEFELLHIMEDYITTSNYTSRGGLTPLDDLITEYAPSLWDRFDDVLWQSATVGGKVMTVPAYWRDNSGDIEGAMVLSPTRFEQYGLEIPQSLDELVPTLKELQAAQREDTGINAYVYEHSLSRCPVMFHRDYDSWPFYASQDGIFMVRQDGSAELYFESEEFKNDSNLMHEMYQEGLIHPDILNLPADTIRANKEAGDALMGIMTPIADQLDESGNVIIEFNNYWLNDDGPFLMNLPLLNSNAVPSTTPYPQAGLKFLDWMYSSQENQDLVLYGVEGEHWEAVGDTEYIRYKDDAGTNLYAFDYWMIEYVPLHRFDVDRTTSEQEDAAHMGNTREDQTVYSPVIGFNFDSEPVSVEFANMMAEYTTSLLPIKLGVVSYEDNFDDAISKMKAAGSDAVIAEYQEQLAAYIASQN